MHLFMHHFLARAHRWEKRRQLLETLRAGTTVVMDRYAFSGVAYTAAKGAQGLDLDWCKAPDAGLPAPDLVLYMQLSKEAAAARAGFGEERYEKTEFQAKVRTALLLLLLLAAKKPLKLQSRVPIETT